MGPLYLHHGGVPNNEGKEVGRAPDGIAARLGEINVTLKSTTALLYHLIPKPQQNPVTQTTKRFNAMHVSVKRGLQPPTVEISPSFDFREAAA